MGDYKQASEAYAKSINLLPKSVKILLFVSGLPEKERLNKLAREMLLSMEVPYGSLVGLGMGLFQQEEYELSNELFARALTIFPKESKTHLYYAMTNFHLGNYELARKHAQIAEKFKEQDEVQSVTFFINKIADCYMRLGQCHALLKEYETALSSFNKAIEVGGSDSRFYSSIAETYLLKGDHLQAVNYYNKALELDPLNEQIKRKIINLQSDGKTKRCPVLF